LFAAAKAPEKPQKKVLIQLKGKNRIHVRQVELTSKALNKADVFILDLGDRVMDGCDPLCDPLFAVSRTSRAHHTSFLCRANRRSTTGTARPPTERSERRASRWPTA
jgi:hypothetical protein